MARKGKLGKKPYAQEGPKQTSTQSKGPPRDKPRNGEAAKKGAGQGDIKKGAGQFISNLGGFIFMCSSSTKADCFKYRVFGLNSGKKSLVEQVRKGMRLFLFDIDLRLLYGIYTAASPGSFKLEPDAFGGSFPWQVRFSIQKDCLPLSEDLFRVAIKENYMDQKKFKVELTTEQVHRLVKLFRPLPGGPGRSPMRPRITAPDYFDAPKAKPPRFSEIDIYGQDKHLLGHPPATKYESNYGSFDRFLSEKPSADIYGQDRHLLGHPPAAKFEPNYGSSDRVIADKPGAHAQSLTKYAHLYSSDDRQGFEGLPQGFASRANRESIYGADDLYLGREQRLQQGLTQTSQIGVGALGGHSLATASLSAYSADPLRPLSDLRLPRARDDIYSVLGDVDPIYRSRPQIPSLRGDILDKRVSALDPLAESLAYTGGLSSEVLRGRSFNDTYASGYGGLPRYESSAGLLSGAAGASGLSYRSELLLPSRYYGGAL